MLFEKEFLSTKRINVLPQRSYYVPFAMEDKFCFTNGIIDVSKSSLYVSLNGSWQFGAFKSLDEITDIAQPLTDTIDVPSCVQCRGYDQVQYINTRYPFPYDPPFVPRLNPTFHYRKTVNIDRVGCYNIVFEGVDSAFYLFVNGKKVGYSQISHAMSEFDLSDYLVVGQNTIDVVVLKWCASSYLECQDKFRFTGIFRNVYLLKRSKQHVTDYKVSTTLRDGKGIVAVTNNSNVDFVCVFNDSYKQVEIGQTQTFVVDNPLVWSSSNPNLYYMIISANGEKIYQQVAIRSVEITNGVFLINGKHEKLKGVNRHESNPLNGATVTVDDTAKDIQLIKSIGANAIRTSHYPDIPQFYELCNYYGIYVLDEADVESHGVACVRNGYDYDLWQDFANNDMFADAVTDREVCLYERDKNFGCVVIWSLGNESSFGKMFYQGADYLHAHDDRPVHYEGTSNIPHDDKDYYSKRIDICSRMYASPQEMLDILSDSNETRPILQCEYSHAMGNSNGDLSDYWQVINSNDRFMGAFVWEWCDHAVIKDGKLLYGGDSGEADHDGNFCVDGLVTPNREFKSNTYELQACYNGKIVADKLVNKCKPLQQLPSDKPLQVQFDKYTGSITDVIVNKKNILAEPITLQFFRANTDNDNHVSTKQLFDAFAQGKVDVRDYVVENNRHKFVGTFGRDTWEIFAKFELVYTIYNNAIDVTLSYTKQDYVDILPRAGVTFALDNSYDNFTFFGYGKGESYVDKRLASTCGEYTLTVEQNFQRTNIKPQECGSHYGTSYVNIGNVGVTAEQPFSFSVLPYSTKQLLGAKHVYDLPTQDKTYVNLDVAMSGIGTHSCGPILDEKYRAPKQATNTFRITFDK